jgi:hypothetical protein
MSCGLVLGNGFDGRGDAENSQINRYKGYRYISI